MIGVSRSHGFWLGMIVACSAAGLVALSACSSSSDSGGGSPDAATDTGTGTDVGTDTNPGEVADTNDAGACPGATDAAGLDDALVEQGRSTVLTRGCANCHQDTPADAGLVLSGRTTSLVDGGAVYPKNLTPDPVDGLGCWTDSQITTAILTAVDKDGKKLCVMPAWGALGMTSAEAAAVTTFLRSLPAVHQLIPPSVCASDAGADGATDGG